MPRRGGWYSGEAGKGSKAVAAERRMQSFELRKAGASYHAIARQIGCSVSSAKRDVDRVMRDIQDQLNPDAVAMRAFETERLNSLLLAVWSNATKGDYAAIDRALRIISRQIVLWGLDKPVTQHINVVGVQYSGPTLDRAIEAKLQELLELRQRLALNAPTLGLPSTEWEDLPSTELNETVINGQYSELALTPQLAEDESGREARLSESLDEPDRTGEGTPDFATGLDNQEPPTP